MYILHFLKKNPVKKISIPVFESDHVLLPLSPPFYFKPRSFPPALFGSLPPPQSGLCTQWQSDVLNQKGDRNLPDHNSVRIKPSSLQMSSLSWTPGAFVPTFAPFQNVLPTVSSLTLFRSLLPCHLLTEALPDYLLYSSLSMPRCACVQTHAHRSSPIPSSALFLISSFYYQTSYIYLFPYLLITSLELSSMNCRQLLSQTSSITGL